MLRPRLIASGLLIAKKCIESEEDCTNATVPIGTQTEPDVVLQAPQDNLTNQEVTAVNDESMKCCEGIVDEKYASLIAKHNSLFKDATGKQ